MNSQLIVTKFENKVKECLQEMYQAIDSSFSRIDTFLDQLSLVSYAHVSQNAVNKAPIFSQISLPSLETLADQVIEPIFNIIIQKELKQKEQQLVQLEQQNKKKISIIQDNHHQYNLKPFTFNLIQNHSIQQSDKCRAIAINKDNSIVLATCEKDIKVFEFKQEQLRQIQILSDHQDNVTTLNFMKKSTQFVSGSHDQQIIIWSMNHNSQWINSQKLNGHSDWIYCLVLNNNEDHIISGGCDNTIKFWVKQNQQWLCSQTITDHADSVYGLSLNEQQNEVISCGSDKLILIIEQSSQDQKWNVIQKIQVEQSGLRLCFINDNAFAFQPKLIEQMHVYEMSCTNKQYVKTKDIAVKGGGTSCQIYFPQQYIKQKCLLVNKNGQNINLIKKNQNDDFITLQSIDFGNNLIMGQMSEDGNYLMTWDIKSKEIQIRKNVITSEED